MSRGQNDEAIVKFRKATELNPSQIILHVRLAEVAELLNQLAEADTQYAQVVAIDPKAAWAWVMWGNFLLKAERFQDAKYKFDRALEIEPTSQAAKDGLTIVNSRLK
jgi:Tfp pilus assembly protein PilF